MAIRVLLVDDVADVRRIVRIALRVRGGFEVVAEASSGAEAVHLTSVHQPDVVVLDLGLPDLAGQEVLVGIRDLSPATKVIVYSGAEPVSRDSLGSHVAGYVLKDGDIDYLVDLLESVGRDARAHATLELAPALASVRRARQFASEKVTEWELPELLDDAILVVSELTANAITHANSHCRLRLSVTRTALRIEVIDTGQGTPEPQLPSTTAEHGRGLHLVDALTSAWGMEILDSDEKLVWAEFARMA